MSDVCKEIIYRMKFLNRNERVIILFLLFAASCVSGHVSFAADPTTEAECKGLTPNPGRCVEVPLIGSSACNSNESAIGSCEKTGVNDRVCCVPQGSTNDATCTRLDCNGVKGVCQTVSCGDGLKKNGICDTTLGVSQVCCIPKDCTPSESSTGSGSNTTSGTASLNYTPLENLPGFEGQGGDFATYFGNLYKLALWIVAISALFMLVVGGFLYLSSAGNTALLGTAKKVIYSALIGLVIALISWLLLDTINSDLTNLKLTGLTGAIGTSGSSSTSSSSTVVEGSGSGCGGAETQSGAHCEDASQTVSDALKCMVDALGNKKMQISSISEDSGGNSLFTKCRDSYSQPPCEHAANSCHYGGKSKASKSCAADISNSYTSNSGAASKAEIKTAAKGCGIPFVNDEGNHVHISVLGCNCDGHS